MKILIFVLFFFLSIFAKGQYTTVTGKVIDKNTQQPLPFATIQVEKTGIGTITNNNGRFSLKISNRYYNNKIYISYLGYKTQERNIKEIKNQIVIFLQPTEKELAEVVIMTKSTLLDLLKKAYKKIPENYPIYPTMLRGFYRETVKTPKNQYLYFAEAVTETYKSGYNVSSDEGQVKILKSMVNVFPLSDTLFKNQYFYSGVFSGNKDDFVKKRYDFINPRHFNKYNYTLKGISNYQGTSVYIINFDTNNDTLSGTMEGMLYIEQTSLAYVACIYAHTKRGIDNYNALKISPYKLISFNTTINFIKYKDVWHIKYISAEQIGINKTHKSNLILNNEYIATEINTDTVKPIPFDKRLEFTDNFSQKAANYYSDDYWSEYNVLEQDTLLKNQIKPLYTTEQSKGLLIMKVNQPKQNLVFEIAKNFSSVIGISYFPIKAGDDEYSVNYANQNKTINFAEPLHSFNYNLCFNLQLNYSLTKRWGIDLSVYRSLESEMYIKAYDIGTSCKFLINKKTKPLILKTSISFSYNNFARDFSTTDNYVGKFSFGGKTIDADKIQFGIGQRKMGVKPQMCLQYKIGKLVWLNASVGYYVDLNTSDRLYVQEKSGFLLTRKIADLNLSDNSLNVTDNGENSAKSHIIVGNYFFDIGLMLKL